MKFGLGAILGFGDRQYEQRMLIFKTNLNIGKLPSVSLKVWCTFQTLSRFTNFIGIGQVFFLQFKFAEYDSKPLKKLKPLLSLVCPFGTK